MILFQMEAQYQQEPDHVPDDTPLYENAPVTKLQMHILLMKYIFKHSVSGVELEDLCKILDMVHPGVLPSSKYLFKKSIPIHLQCSFHFYCAACSGLIQEGSRECQQCHAAFDEKLARDQYFIRFSVEDQLVDVIEQYQPSLLIKSEMMRSSDYRDILSGDIHGEGTVD